MSGWQKDREHLVRMALLFAVGISSFFVLRAAMMPAGFGQFGHYRPGALDDNRNLPLRHAGRAVCETCHPDVVEVRKGSRHERIGCEGCHGPLNAHAQSSGEVKPKHPDTRELCLRCHATSPWKPKTYPQVNVVEHGGAGACTACHKPHAPKIS